MTRILYDKDLVATRIKECRKSSNLTQKQVSEKTNISLTSIKQYESAKRIPDKYNLSLLANLFGVKEEYLLGTSKFKNWLHKYDEEHKEKIADIKKDISLFEALDTICSSQFGFDSSDESVFPEFLKYLDNFTERRKAMKTVRASEVDIVRSSDNCICENFETGKITIYADSEAGLQKAYDTLLDRGIRVIAE